MPIVDRAKRIGLGRCLLVGVLVFVMMFLFRLYVVPLHPALDGPLLAALAAGAMAAAGWWVAFRWWGG